MNKTEVLDSVNWTSALAAHRSSGGHTDVMDSIFDGAANVIAEYVEDDYSGQVAYAYEFPDGTVVVITDYFGSCSGCDAWEDATDADATTMITSMVTSSRVFPDRESAAQFCRGATDDACDYSHRATQHLVFTEPALVHPDLQPSA